MARDNKLRKRITEAEQGRGREPSGSSGGHWVRRRWGAYFSKRAAGSEKTKLEAQGYRVRLVKARGEDNYFVEYWSTKRGAGLKAFIRRT